jgi:hypothetical protein
MPTAGCGSTHRPRGFATAHDVSGEYRSIVSEHHQYEQPFHDIGGVCHAPGH